MGEDHLPLLRRELDYREVTTRQSVSNKRPGDYFKPVGGQDDLLRSKLSNEKSWFYTAYKLLNAE